MPFLRQRSSLVKLRGSPDLVAMFYAQRDYRIGFSSGRNECRLLRLMFAQKVKSGTRQLWVTREQKITLGEMRPLYKIALRGSDRKPSGEYRKLKTGSRMHACAERQASGEGSFPSASDTRRKTGRSRRQRVQGIACYR